VAEAWSPGGLRPCGGQDAAHVVGARGPAPPRDWPVVVAPLAPGANGSAAAEEVAANGHQAPQDAANGAAAIPDSPATVRRCNSCQRELPLRAFEKHRHHAANVGNVSTRAGTAAAGRGKRGRGGAGVSPGLTTAELLATSPRPEALAVVLNDEARRGRVERRGNRWRLIEGAFAPEVLEAVALLDKPGGRSGCEAVTTPGG
jgi:hypothetical protein